MNKYRAFILEAKLNAAPGFGAPQAPPKSGRSKKPTADEIAHWFARYPTERSQKNYLKSYPNSKFKDVTKPKNNIITNSKKTSSHPIAKAVMMSSVSWLAGLGVKSRGIAKNEYNKVHGNLGHFLNSDNRKKFIDTATTGFSKILGKLPVKERSDVEDEAKAIHANPREKPSKVINRKGFKGKLPALIGLAAGAAILGVATGVIPGDVAAYLGVKVLDTAVEAIRGIGSDDGFADTFVTLLAGHAISSFLKSKDSDEYAHGIQDKLEAQGAGQEDIEEESVQDSKKDDEKEATPENKRTREDLKKAGIDLPEGYEEDENGNMRRKRSSK